MSEENVSNTNSTPVEKDSMAVIAYITLIGFIIALVKNQENKSPLVSYHLAQSLGIILTLVACTVVAVIPILGWIVYLVGWVLCIIMLVKGAINANNGKMEPTIIFGELYNKWFGDTFK